MTSGYNAKDFAPEKKKGMKFVGTTIIYSYLQAIGVVNSHDENCDLYHAT